MIEVRLKRRVTKRMRISAAESRLTAVPLVSVVQVDGALLAVATKEAVRPVLPPRDEVSLFCALGHLKAGAIAHVREAVECLNARVPRVAHRPVEPTEEVACLLRSASACGSMGSREDRVRRAEPVGSAVLVWVVRLLLGVGRAVATRVPHLVRAGGLGVHGAELVGSAVLVWVMRPLLGVGRAVAAETGHASRRKMRQHRSGDVRHAHKPRQHRVAGLLTRSDRGLSGGVGLGVKHASLSLS